MKTKKLDLRDVENGRISLWKDGKELCYGDISVSGNCMLDWIIINVAHKDAYVLESSDKTFDDSQACLDELRDAMEDEKTQYNIDGDIVELRDSFPNYVHCEQEWEDEEGDV